MEGAGGGGAILESLLGARAASSSAFRLAKGGRDIIMVLQFYNILLRAASSSAPNQTIPNHIPNIEAAPSVSGAA